MAFFQPLILFFQFLALATYASLHLLFGGVTSTVSIVLPPQPVPSTTKPPTSSAASNPVPAATSTKTVAVVKAASKPAPKPAPTISTIATTPAPQSQPILVTKSQEDVNTETRAALVNILCTTQAGGSFDPISGSGVIIDARGVVLTNAHVGQFFLLRDYLRPDNVDCVLRTGSPAQPTYTAKLLYLPPAWIDKNAPQIKSPQATGTGENDYSFLLITGMTQPGASLPSLFPALAMTATAPDEGDQMLLAAYPAGFLDGQTIQMNLYISSAITAVQQLYTFKDPKNVDAVAVGGTIVSQSGSSGGAVVRLTDGKLVGIISTDTASSTTAGRELDAITISHIDRSLATQSQGGIIQLLTSDLQAEAAKFASTTGQTETKQLEDVLGK